MTGPENPCAGRFGAIYDFYIERERLSRLIGRVVWGIDTSRLYASIQTAVGPRDNGETILDVPCGGGVALRALEPGQRVRYIAVDLSEQMLARARRRAARRSLSQVELVAADMLSLPFEDAVADVVLSYSGLHAVRQPRPALGEIVRCLRPGGHLAGGTFLAEGSRRQRLLFAGGRRRGQPVPTFTSSDLRRWLAAEGIIDARIQPHLGYAVFDGVKAQN